MPELDLIAKRELRWDAEGALVAAIYFPDDAELRAGYEARWRAEHKGRLPPRTQLRVTTTHEPAKRFSAHASIGGKLRKRRQRIERVGTLLLMQAAVSKTSPLDATESRVEHALTEVAGLSRSSSKRDLNDFRGVIHWCAAIAYQRKNFGSPLRSHPQLGPVSYTPTAALFDFLRLGHQFFAFARDSGCFAPTETFLPERDLWTLSDDLRGVAPQRDPTWPDCDRIRAILPVPAVYSALREYSATLYRA
jgi:hypothetical protein